MPLCVWLFFRYYGCVCFHVLLGENHQKNTWSRVHRVQLVHRHGVRHGLSRPSRPRASRRLEIPSPDDDGLRPRVREDERPRVRALREVSSWLRRLVYCPKRPKGRNAWEVFLFKYTPRNTGAKLQYATIIKTS